MDSVSHVYSKPRMHGVPDKLYLCQFERQDELNDRISSRNIPSAPLQPFFTQVPVSTKYGYMPILDQHKPATVPFNEYPIFSPHVTFNPGNSMAPWTGFANNVNVESTLRRQFFGLQNCDQSEYVPSSTSDLYNVYVPPSPVKQPFPNLFKREIFDHCNPNPNNLGNNFFNNSTRMENKDIVPEEEKQFYSEEPTVSRQQPSVNRKQPTVNRQQLATNTK